ncbi:MAG: hypothetical protein EB002_10290 [Betaproteobacteria bacterium]|nr:hypothetical protein [Betaproteobacteria bacterium]
MIRNTCEGEPVTALATGVVWLRGLVLMGYKLKRMMHVRRSNVSKNTQMSPWPGIWESGLRFT